MGRRASKVKHRPILSCIYPGLPLVVAAAETAGPRLSGPHSPKLPRASWGLLGSLVRGISCFLCSGCSKQKVRGTGQETGWLDPGSNQDEEIGLEAGKMP